MVTFMNSNLPARLSNPKNTQFLSIKRYLEKVGMRSIGLIGAVAKEQHNDLLDE